VTAERAPARSAETPPAETPPAETPPAAGAAPLILIVDDMAETRRLMRRVLERAALRVVEADDGLAGLAAIREHRPDAVVLDLRLPGMSGFEVARTIRADPDAALAATPILACSASVQAEVRREALDAGCDDFEGKPFDIRRFPTLLLGLIAQRRAV
jgi:CheY-like chemotaxis protein